MHYLKQFYIAIVLIFLGIGIALFFYYFQPRPDQSSADYNNCDTSNNQFCEI